MTHVRLLTVATLIGLTVSLVPLAARAGDPAVKCESGKLKESSKYAACRLKADAKAVTKGEAADYAKCEAKFADKWAKTETKAGVGICPSEGDQVSMDARITIDAAEIATLLAGGSVTDWAGELSACTGSLSTCTGSLSTCNGDLTNCNDVDVPAAFEAGEEAGCVAGGGTWSAVSFSCSPPSSYNCFVGGFCAQAAISFPPASYGYTNVYEGHTQSTEPALGAGCNSVPGSQEWNAGGDEGAVGFADLSAEGAAGLLTFFGPECASN